VSSPAVWSLEDARAVAELVVDVLQERGLVSPRERDCRRVLTVGDVAELLGRSRAWVYEHAAELPPLPALGADISATLGCEPAESRRRNRHGTFTWTSSSRSTMPCSESQDE
jgi:hypothetical protein